MFLLSGLYLILHLLSSCLNRIELTVRFEIIIIHGYLLVRVDFDKSFLVLLRLLRIEV